MLAVTGTDGKTTTTMMAAAMLRCAGLKVAAVGNTELPLIAALDTDVDAFVVECSSFRLNWIEHFRSEASVWLNLAPDHQNWHVSMEAYEQAKARMWSHNRAERRRRRLRRRSRRHAQPRGGRRVAGCTFGTDSCRLPAGRARRSSGPAARSPSARA